MSAGQALSRLPPSRVAWFVGAWAVLAALGQTFTLDHHLSVVWPPAGLALGAVLAGGRAWAWVGGVCALVTALVLGASPWAAATAGGATIAGVLVTRWLLRRLEYRPTVHRTYDAFLLGCVAPPVMGLVSGVGGGLALATDVAAPDLLAFVGTRGLAHAIGVLVFAPAVLTLADPDPLDRRWGLETVLGDLISLAVGVWVFLAVDPAGVPRAPLAFLVTPCLVWGALRSPPAAALSRLAVMSALAVVGTARGTGPFADLGLVGPWILGAHVAVKGVTTLLLAATVTQSRHEARARSRAEAALRESQGELLHAQRLDALGALAGGIAHDFNNLLAVIELDLRALNAGEPAGPLVAEASLAARRARALVDQILTFSRGEPVSRAAVDLREVVLETVGLLRGATPPTVRVVVEGGGAARVNGVREQLQQLVLNLVTNAVRAVIGVGEVRVTVGGHGGWVELVVADEGVGMDATTRRRMFEPFFTTRSDGSGLGLSVVERVATTHGGRIEVESEVGRGTTVRVRLPALAEPASVPRPQRVLLVDDDHIVLAAYARALRARGHVVHAVDDGARALDDFRASPEAYDLLISDVTMPGLDGVRVAEAVARIRPGTPIVLTTGCSDAVPAEDLARSGVLGVLAKPFSVADLERMVGLQGDAVTPP